MQSLMPARTRSSLGMGEDIPSYVTPAEVDRAVQMEPREEVKLLIRFLFVAGPRISEALAVTVADVDFHLRLVRMHTSKVGDPRAARAVPVPPELLGLLAIHINARRLAHQDRLWSWSRSRAFELVRDALQRSGIERKRCHPHTLRHGTAVHLLTSGVPIHVVQKVLGHRFLTSTMIYLRATAQDVRRHLDAVEW